MNQEYYSNQGIDLFLQAMEDNGGDAHGMEEEAPPRKASPQPVGPDGGVELRQGCVA